MNIIDGIFRIFKSIRDSFNPNRKFLVKDFETNERTERRKILDKDYNHIVGVEGEDK